ncbi:MAG: formamidopyrimidine-DNA glycosylase [Actinobacteria bacterium]|nr:formamidopyrimidine-DNA glycosylase [Actinomycetota bacterium]
MLIVSHGTGDWFVADVTTWPRPTDNGFVPEILEVEMYAEAARRVIGRRVSRVTHLDSLVVGEPSIVQGLEGKRITDVTRLGKVLTLHTSLLAVDLHFGMSGRIVVDGRSPIDELSYAASDDSRWIRFGLSFGKGFLYISDPRRFARVQPTRHGEGLGPDAMTISKQQFRECVTGRNAPIKAVLLDQSSVAGLGNMLVDEILWRADVDPHRKKLDAATVDLIHAKMRAVLPQLARRGGSHAGRLSVKLRVPGSACPRDGALLSRATVGGRTTFWCPKHQR